MANYKFLDDHESHSFPVANTFIDRFMPSANATFVKVYLYGLRQCFGTSKELDNKKIAEALNILESDVVLAWQYWESVGVVNINRPDSSKPYEFDVEFINLAVAFQAPKEPKETTVTKKVLFDTRPNYSPEEISIYIEQDESIHFMYQTAQQKLGKMLSSADINILYSFYDWLRLPVEVIVMLLEYCASMNKTNMRYIEKVALNWADQGINTMEKAELHLSQLERKNSTFFEIKKCLGITDRDLSETEENYILQWTEKMGFNKDIIKLAYEQTVLNTGKISFPYMNSILESWHEKAIKTVQAVETDILQHKKDNKEKYNKNVASKTPAKPNKFSNFTQRKYDFEELERRVMEKRINYLKESR